MSLTFNRIRERVSFELGKEIERDGFRLVTSVGQKKFFKVVHEESNLRPSDSALRCSTMFFWFFSSVLFFVLIPLTT